jgi:hypothetical protein
MRREKNHIARRVMNINVRIEEEVELRKDGSTV